MISLLMKSDSNASVADTPAWPFSTHVTQHVAGSPVGAVAVGTGGGEALKGSVMVMVGPVTCRGVSPPGGTIIACVPIPPWWWLLPPPQGLRPGEGMRETLPVRVGLDGKSGMRIMEAMGPRQPSVQSRPRRSFQ
jgi:hypothetical protein